MRAVQPYGTDAGTEYHNGDPLAGSTPPAAFFNVLNAELSYLVTKAGLTLSSDDSDLTQVFQAVVAIATTIASKVAAAFATAAEAVAGTVSDKVISPLTLAAVLTARKFASYASAQTWTGVQSCAVVVLTDAASIAWDLSAGQMAEVTIAASRTLAAPTNQIAGTMYQLRVIHGAASTTLAFASAYTGVSALSLSTTSGAVDVLTFRANGTSTMELIAVAKGTAA